MKDRPTVRIDKTKCKGCVLCIEVCPQKILEVSDDVNERGLRYVVVINPAKCTGCGLCVMMCPDCGIEITYENEAKK